MTKTNFYAKQDFEINASIERKIYKLDHSNNNRLSKKITKPTVPIEAEIFKRYIYKAGSSN